MGVGVGEVPPPLPEPLELEAFEAEAADLSSFEHELPKVKTSIRTIKFRYFDGVLDFIVIESGKNPASLVFYFSREDSSLVTTSGAAGRRVTTSSW